MDRLRQAGDAAIGASPRHHAVARRLPELALGQVQSLGRGPLVAALDRLLQRPDRGAGAPEDGAIPELALLRLAGALLGGLVMGHGTSRPGGRNIGARIARIQPLSSFFSVPGGGPITPDEGRSLEGGGA